MSAPVIAGSSWDEAQAALPCMMLLTDISALVSLREVAASKLAEFCIAIR